MKVNILGGGPGGLYSAILLKRHHPDWNVELYERGPRHATWGFGVVFSDRALEFLRADDQAMYDLITPQMETWPDLTIVHNDTRIPISGNGFASIGRLRLLNILHDEAERVGAVLHFEQDIQDQDRLMEADLVIAADGASSSLREAHAQAFETRVDLRPNKFIWYGTSKAFDSLTLTFRSTPHGVFCAHHYRYAPDMSTFLVEVTAETFERVGFANMDEEATRKFCESVFANDLAGHPILSNKSYWRNFPAIWNERWSHQNLVLLGDALRTAHFSIGSGTRLAMEDAIALARALRDEPDLQAALQLYQARRMPPMKKIWDAANVSLRWYERMDELMALDPYEFAYSYMTRSGRVDHAELRRRDPGLAAAYERLHPELAAQG